MAECIVVRMEQNDSLEIEKAWYEYCASLAVVKELMKDSDVDFDILQEYINVTESRWYVVEKAKEKLGKIYKPGDIDLNDYGYSFDFDEREIRFCHRDHLDLLDK